MAALRSLWLFSAALSFGQAADLPLASCSNATSVSVTVNWAPTAGSDVYYVALTASPSPPLQPFTIQTSASSSAILLDLLPNKTFFVTVYAHPQTADLVWDWKQVTAPKQCSTMAVGRKVPYGLQREGPLARSSIDVSWTPPLEAPVGGYHHQEIGYSRKSNERDAGAAWTWTHVSKEQSRHQLNGLVPDSTYRIRIRAVSMSLAPQEGDSIELRTGPLVGSYTQVYRISEYQFQPDFLDNHDAGDIDSIPIYIMDHNPITTASISPHWDQCEAALPKILPGMHGEGLPCLEYAAKYKRDEITAACGNFSTKDDFVGWDVHWYGQERQE
jgi:hypothetical protein